MVEFDPPAKLLLGLVTGFAFGFLLQRGQVAKFRVIVGQLLLRDFTVVKIMGTAVVVGSLGAYVLVSQGLATLHVKPLALAGLVAGGVLFGAGMAVLGYCPGTGVAACGEGRRDAMAGVLGMLVGAGLYVGLFGVLSPLASAWGDWGKVTIPGATGTSPWGWVAGLGAVWLVAVALTCGRPGRERRRAREVTA